MSEDAGLETGVSESVDIAHGFKTLGMSIKSLAASVAALAGMQNNFGTSGSGPQSQLAGGTNARAGATTVQGLAAARLVPTPDQFLGTTPSGLYAPQGAINAAFNRPTPPGPPLGTPPPPTPVGGQLAQAGRRGFNMLAGQTTTGGWGMGPNGPTYTPPKGPPGAGGSFGGTGSSGGLYGGAMGALQKLPVVGQALGLVDEIQSQRQKNAYYQSIEGGSNAHGFGERWNEALGSFTTMGMFAPGEYADLYKSVTKLGYTDRFDNAMQSRQGAINFAYSNKRDLGMDASESTNYIATASRSATASFTELGKVLQDVSDSAAKAGVNTQMARKQFDDLWQNNLNNGLTGGAAMETAGATQAFISGMGRQFANTSFAGATSTGMNYMVASTNGQTYNQFLATANRNPGQAAAMREKTQSMGLDSLITSDIKAWIKSQVDNVGGPSAIEADKTLADTFWPDFLAAYPGLDWNAVKGILQTFSGAQFASDTDAFEYLVQWVMGKDANQMLIQKSKDAQIKSGKAASDEDLGMDWKGSLSDAGTAYKKWSQNTGKVDPVIESMLKGFNSGGLSQQDQKVEVVTKGGPRVVSLADAVSNFSDQLASGQAKFVGGSLNGQTAGAFGTLDQSASRIASAKAEAANSNNADMGQSLQEYLKSNPASGTSSSGGSNTNVTISLAPGVANLFNVQTSTDSGVTPNANGGQTFNSRMASVH